MSPKNTFSAITPGGRQFGKDLTNVESAKTVNTSACSVICIYVNVGSVVKTVGSIREFNCIQGAFTLVASKKRE
jgi:hypothetical protein